MNRKHVYTLVILTIAVTGCKTTGFNGKTIDVNGMIYDFANKPVAYCEITLGETYAATTDINGRFTLPKVPPGTYGITGSKNGYETYMDYVTIQDWGQIIYIRIPSQNQLLNLIDEAMTVMNFGLAEEYMKRAYEIDKTNVEMLFYYAAIKFRQQKYNEAVSYLEAAKSLGSRDTYIDRFLTILKELINAENNK